MRALKNRFTGVVFAYSNILASNTDMLEGDLDPVTRVFTVVDKSPTVQVVVPEAEAKVYTPVKSDKSEKVKIRPSNASSFSAGE